VEEVLQAVRYGVDIFDSSYPINVTAGGYALHFPWGPEPHDTSAAAVQAEAVQAEAQAEAVAAEPSAAAAAAAGSKVEGSPAAVAAAAGGGGAETGAMNPFGNVGSSSSSGGGVAGADFTKLNLWSLEYRWGALGLRGYIV
jgi:hypothetical protein